MQYWVPDNFDEVYKLYPNTPNIEFNNEKDRTNEFIRNWVQYDIDDSYFLDKLQHHLAHTNVFFIRGFLGNFMFNNLLGPSKKLKSLGINSTILKNNSRASVYSNSLVIKKQLHRHTNNDNQFILCSHSRSGYEAILGLDNTLLNKLKGILFTQMPRSHSLVIDSILYNSYKITYKNSLQSLQEKFLKIGLILMNCRQAAYELSSVKNPEIIQIVSSFIQQSNIKMLHMLSWSEKPVVWTDSFHGRLSQITPGVAHDGQFLLENLYWQELPFIKLPRLDHAQPAVGMAGFDHVKYWVIKLLMLLDDE